MLMMLMTLLLLRQLFVHLGVIVLFFLVVSSSIFCSYCFVVDVFFLCSLSLSPSPSPSSSGLCPHPSG